MKRLNLFLGAVLAILLVNPVLAQEKLTPRKSTHDLKAHGIHTHQHMGQNMGQKNDGDAGCAMMNEAHSQAFFQKLTEELELSETQIAKLEQIKVESPGMTCLAMTETTENKHSGCKMNNDDDSDNSKYRGRIPGKKS